MDILRHVDPLRRVAEWTGDIKAFIYQSKCLDLPLQPSLMEGLFRLIGRWLLFQQSDKSYF